MIQLGYTPCHPGSDPGAAVRAAGAPGNAGGGSAVRPRLAPRQGAAAALQEVAAGLRCGAAPWQLMESIDAASRQAGNRAFMRWVGALHGAGEVRERRINAVPGRWDPACPRAGAAPLQFGPKKQRKKKEPAAQAAPGVPAGAAPKPGAAAVTGALSETPSGSGATAGPEAQATAAQDKAGEAGVSGEKKKKKKSRVQVALNTLREEGVGAFRDYVEARIGEAALLHTLTERITRAQDLGGVSTAALDMVQARLTVLDPLAVADLPQAAARQPGQVVQRAVTAPARTKLGPREFALFECCYKGDAVRFKQFLKFGDVDPNVAVENGTLLTIAAYNGYTSIVRELLSKRGIDINLADPSGGTPLLSAVQQGHREIVKLLLKEHAIKPNLGTPCNGTTPLISAVYSGDKSMVELLLTLSSVNVNVRQFNGGTALYVAVQDNYPDIVELLIRSGAEVNLDLCDKSSPLSMAAYNGNTRIMKTLLQAPGIRVNQKTRKGASALFYAAQQGHTEVVELLLDKGGDADLADIHGTVPLHMACLLGHTGVVRELLNAGADTEHLLSKKYTPCQLARLGGHAEVVALFESHRRDGKQQPLPVENLSLEDRPGRTTHPEVQLSSLPEVDTVAAVQPEDISPATEDSRESGSQGEMAQANTTQAAAAVADNSGTVPAGQAQVTEFKSPLAHAKQEFRQDIQMRLRNDWLDPLQGVRLLEDINTAESLDTLCSLYNRLAHIERLKERSRQHRSYRARASVARAVAAVPLTVPSGFALGSRKNLHTEAVENEIRKYLDPAHHKFISQAVNNMEFGRGKPTAGYPGLWHTSAGIPGAGSCSVFYYTDKGLQSIRIVGIGHHLDRGTYRLDYADAESGIGGKLFRIS